MFAVEGAHPQDTLWGTRASFDDGFWRSVTEAYAVWGAIRDAAQGLCLVVVPESHECFTVSPKQVLAAYVRAGRAKDWVRLKPVAQDESTDPQQTQPSRS